MDLEDSDPEYSSDESSRDDEEYEAQTARYGRLLQRALQLAGPDLDGPGDEESISGMNGASHSHTGKSSRAGHVQLRRLLLRGLAPSAKTADVCSCLAQFGPIARFMLFVEPASQQSLCFASVVYRHAADAAQAMEAAAASRLYLSNVWAPEVTLEADENGELACRAYEAQVHKPPPSLVRLIDDATGDGTVDFSPTQRRQQDGLKGVRVLVHGVSAHLGEHNVEMTLEQYGRIQRLSGARSPPFYNIHPPLSFTHV